MSILNLFFQKIKYRKYMKKNKFIGIFSISKNVRLKNCIIGHYANFADNSSVVHSVIGDYSSIGRYSKITHTEIGKYCAISWDSSINAVSHPYTHLTISSFPYVPKTGNFVTKKIQSHETVIIKNDVWVGTGCVIMPGITIGNGAIIGAGSVVTKDVPDYAIVAGVPAKIIKFRFKDKIIKRLLKLSWWDLDENIIKENIHLWQGEVSEEVINNLELINNKGNKQ